MGAKTSKSTTQVNIKEKLICRKVEQLLDTVYDDDTQELNYTSIVEFWETLKNKTIFKKKCKNKEGLLKAFYNLEFTNSNLKISQLLIIHLKEEHMIELLRRDASLADSIKDDLDSEGNTCGHIALMYDKQEVLSELISLNPKLAVIRNKKGECISEIGERFNRTCTEAFLTARMMTSPSSVRRHSLLADRMDSSSLSDSMDRD